MLRTIKYYLTGLVLLVGTSSCLDVTPESAFPEKEAMQNFADAEQTVTGIYSMLMDDALFSGYLTLLPDIQADLVYGVEGNSNTYGNIWQWDIRSNNAQIEAVYAALYTVISRCNFYLERVDGVVEREINDANLEKLEEYTGEVYAIRALCYSELLKCFCKAYDPATAKNELGVVIRRYFSTPEPLRRASLYDSYQFVLDDLAEAEKRLDKKHDAFSNEYISVAAAEALHARVALYMQDWDNAIKYASILIDDKKETFRLADAKTNYSTDYTYYDYMWAYDASYEIIWRIGFNITSYGGALGSVFLNFNKDFVHFFPDYVPATWALNLYGDGDLRASSIFSNQKTGYSNGLTWPLLVKYYGNRNFIDNQLFHISMPKPFRLSEQYLIRAEAYCQNKEFSKASADLTAMRKMRYKSGGVLNVTKDNWLENISNERVRELFMEGFRLHDLKRWGKGFERKQQSCAQAEGSRLKVAASDPLFVWPIPQHELDAPGADIQPNESNK